MVWFFVTVSARSLASVECSGRRVPRGQWLFLVCRDATCAGTSQLPSEGTAKRACFTLSSHHATAGLPDWRGEARGCSLCAFGKCWFLQALERSRGNKYRLSVTKWTKVSYVSWFKVCVTVLNHLPGWKCVC